MAVEDGAIEMGCFPWYDPMSNRGQVAALNYQIQGGHIDPNRQQWCTGNQKALAYRGLGQWVTEYSIPQKEISGV